MAKMRNKNPKRGRRASTILNRWRSGYLLNTIAHELEITRHQVAKVLYENGISWLALESRAKKRKSSSTPPVVQRTFPIEGH